MILAMSTFSSSTVRWQKTQGRHDLPWQGNRDPYRIWLAEIMLQQTQVSAVIPYYTRFLGQFPTIAALANASEDAVMPYWAGLGYYARARNLHKAARVIRDAHAGEFPRTLEEIVALPGIGRSTAAAIAAFAFGTRAAILDGNVKRVLARHFGMAGDIKTKAVETALWALAEAHLPRAGIEAYTQGLMDMGATLCTRTSPHCTRCPVKRTCVALAQDRIATLPGRAASKPTPHRTVQMLVLIASGEVLLEKRPSPGIWGGLWSLPEVSSGDDALVAAKKRFGVSAKLIATLPVVPHGFTHYGLAITPVKFAVRARGKRAALPGLMWLNLADASAAALPAPVKRILAAL